MHLTKREQIIEAAHGMFLEHGFGATSMDAVAARANVSKRTIYSHFETKEGLFREVVSGFCQKMSSALHETEGNLSTRAQLLQVATQLVEIILHPEAIATLRIVMAEKDQFPNLAHAFWEAGPLLHLNAITGIFRHAPDLEIDDPELAARQFAGMLKGPYFLSTMLGTETRPQLSEIQAHVELSVDRFIIATKTA